MEKIGPISYRSTTVLGQLYDQVQPYSVELTIDATQEISYAKDFPYQLFVVDGYKDYQTEADAMKNEYNRELRRLMRQYGMQNEQEVISGYILKFNAKQYAKEAKIFEIRQEITNAYRVIREK